MKKILLILILCLFSPLAWAAGNSESAYDRVMRTGVLRCAYIVYPPETIKDANTGALSGTIVDLTEKAATLLDLKVEWVTEVGFADMFDGLYSGKYDALCSGLWESPARARMALFTVPINYGIHYAFVRTEDHRFDTNLGKLNNPGMTIAVIDGEYGESVARESYANAKAYRLPQLSDVSQMLLSVGTGKADVTFLQLGSARGYLDHNPGQLRALTDHPVRVMPAPALAVARNEQQLKSLLDVSFRYLLNNGEVERVLRHYNPELDSYALIAKPYQ